MKAHLVIKQNIDALLTARGQTRRDLAQHVMQTLDKRADSWISHIFGKKGYYTRVMPSQYLDRIAAFFGVQVYQLFQPGIFSAESERRTRERRVLADRRSLGRRLNFPVTTIRQVFVTPEDEALLEELHALDYETYQHVKAWVTTARLAHSRRSKRPPPDEPPPGGPGAASPTHPRGKKKGGPK